MLARGTRMYEGFERFEIQTSDPEVKIVGRVGGKGPLPCGHYPAEQVPDLVHDELRQFLKS